MRDRITVLTPELAAKMLTVWAIDRRWKRPRQPVLARALRLVAEARKIAPRGTRARKWV